MSSFHEANQARLSLKMKLCHYYWYQSIDVLPYEDKYYLGVNVKKGSLNIKNMVPSFVRGICVKIVSD